MCTYNVDYLLQARKSSNIALQLHHMSTMLTQITTQRTHDVIVMWLLRQNYIATSFWRDNDVVIASRVCLALHCFSNCWFGLTKKEGPHYCPIVRGIQCWPMDPPLKWRSCSESTRCCSMCDTVQLGPIRFDGWVMAEWLGRWTQQWVVEGVCTPNSFTLETGFREWPDTWNSTSDIAPLGFRIIDWNFDTFTFMWFF